MSKLLTTLLAVIFAAVTLTPIAFAAKHEMEKKEMKKETTKAAPKKESPVAKACKGKKPGAEVTVDGKKVKCPAPKKETKKDQMKK
jgi:chaperone required for assembly of F1-ATPase